MEFIPNVPIHSQSLWEPGQLTTLGKVIPFDMLVFNWDRIPSSAFNNDGNLGNLLLHRDSGELYAIDTACTLLNIEIDSTKCEKFAAKCLHLLSECLSENESELRTSTSEGFKLWFNRGF